MRIANESDTGVLPGCFQPHPCGVVWIYHTMRDAQAQTAASSVKP